jgi:hypothetical protein
MGKRITPIVVGILLSVVLQAAAAAQTNASSPLSPPPGGGSAAPLPIAKETPVLPALGKPVQPDWTAYLIAGFGLIAATAAVFAALAAFQAARANRATMAELMAARQQGLRPALHFLSPPTWYDVNWEPGRDGGLRILVRPKDDPSHGARPPGLLLVNVGVGAALDITFAWRFQTGEVAKMIAQSRALQRFGAALAGSALELVAPHHASLPDWKTACAQQAESFLKYCPPVGPAVAPLFVELPSEIASAVALYFIATAELHTLPRACQVDLDVTYRDFSGGTFAESLRVVIYGQGGLYQAGDEGLMRAQPEDFARFKGDFWLKAVPKTEIKSYEIP